MFEQVLKAVAVALIVRKVVGAASSSVVDNIVVGFNNIKLRTFTFEKSTVQMSIVVTNKNTFSIAMTRFKGILSFGPAKVNVLMTNVIEIPSHKTVIANFDLTINNGQFLRSIGELIGSKQKPKLRIDGMARIGLNANKVIDVPVVQDIPIQINLL